jgi:hypothetical protein
MLSMHASQKYILSTVNFLLYNPIFFYSYVIFSTAPYLDDISLFLTYSSISGKSYPLFTHLF